MACLNCHQSREEGDNFCRRCGDNLVTSENPKHTINILMAVIGAELLISVAWLTLQKAVAPVFFKDQFGNLDWNRLAPIYKVFGWFTDIALVIVTLVCILLLKNRSARILLAIFLVFRIVFIVAFRVFDQNL